MKAFTGIFALLALVVAFVLPACDSGGVPVRMRIDEFTMDLDLDEMLAEALGEFKSIGLFPAETQHLPELWPDSLPAVQYSIQLAAPPIPVDLTPEPGSEDADKYKDISAAEGAIVRIELNRMVVRVEASNISIGLPELKLQVAVNKDASPEDRLAWRTIGTLPGAEPEFIGDLELEFFPGGESFLNSQLADEEKEFAIRMVSKLEVDTQQNARLPSGKAQVRLIVVATFFVDPAGAIDAVQ